MSDLKKDKPLKTNEEVDLIVFFNLIGNALGKVFSFIEFILKTVFSFIIIPLKELINNWKIIISVVLISIIIGYSLDRNKPESYQSQMIVRPYFDSKYQLVNNINFFNTLINSQNYEQLNKIFNSDSSSKIDVKLITGFEIEPGPKTQNDYLIEYQDYFKTLDSFGKTQSTFKSFLKNKNIYSENMFLITAETSNKTIFSKLTKGVSAAFYNDFSKEKKIKEDKIRQLQHKNIIKNIKQVDSLQKIYINVLKEESGNPKISPIKLAGITLGQEKVITREYELLEKRIALRKELQKIEEEIISNDVFVDVITNFQSVGNKRSNINKKYAIIFPALAFFGLCLFYLVQKTVIYVINYEN